MWMHPSAKCQIQENPVFPSARLLCETPSYCQGGPAVLLGKTGGYAIGYLLAALIAGAFAAM